MGQQQLMLIVLGVIIVGIAVILGINLFNKGMIQQKREILINEGVNLVKYAYEYFKKPTILAGGAGSFEGWDIPESLKNTDNGTFEISSISSDLVIIKGIGKEIGNNNEPIEIEISIDRTNFNTSVVN